MADQDSISRDSQNKDCKGNLATVALVNGHPISMREIGEKCSGKEDCLIKMLTISIKRIIYNEDCSKYGIHVTENEMREYWGKMTANKVAMTKGDYKGVEMFIIGEKMKKIVDKKIAAQDHDYAHYLEIISLPDYRNYRNEISGIITRFSAAHGNAKIADYGEAQRHLWWKKRYSSAQVRILDPSLVSAWDDTNL
jgi:hypothetical protein